MLDNNYGLVHEQGDTAGNKTLNTLINTSNQLFFNFACCVENSSVFLERMCCFAKSQLNLNRGNGHNQEHKLKYTEKESKHKMLDQLHSLG